MADWPHEDDERVTVRWGVAVRRDPLYAPPAIDRERVYAPFIADLHAPVRHDELAAYAVGDGMPLWRRDLPDRIAVRAIATGQSLVIVGPISGARPAPDNGIVLGLDPATGAARWRQREPLTV